MRVRLRRGWAAMAVLAGLMGLGSVQCVAQESGPLNDSTACKMMKTSLASIQKVTSAYTNAYDDVEVQSLTMTGSRLTASGFIVSLDGSDLVVNYPGIKSFNGDLKEENYPHSIFFRYRDPQPKGQVKKWALGFSNDSMRAGFDSAIDYLMKAADDGRLPDCNDRLRADSKAELDAFPQATAAWRAMNPKPALSEEVVKKRLLAEDDVANKNMAAAIEDYEAGIKLDPTWAQGWYNLAQLYAAQNDFEQAVFSMKHYLILLPDAPDAAEAKNDVLLWEARAEKAAGK